MRNNYIKKTLKNGVTLVMYIDKNMRKTYVEYSINYGSNGKWFDFYYKDKKYHVLPGCAHFLEHMLGEHSKYGNIYKYFSSMKYDNNGGTSADYTHYFFVGVNDINESIEKIINIVDDPVFTKEDVEETKYAIIEETKRVINNKARVGYSLYKRNLYKGVDLFHESLSSIGNETTTKELNYETLKLCYDAFYYDANKTLLIAGNFDEKEMVDYVESIYAKIKSHKKEMKEYEYGDLDKVKKKREIYYMPTNDDYVTIGFKEGNKLFTKKEVNYFTNFIFNYKLSDSKDFKHKLKKNNIISYFTESSYSFYDDTHYDIAISASVKDVDKFIKELIKYLKVNDLTEEDFNIYKKSEIADQALLKDYKYRAFNSYIFRKDFSEDFDDIDFIGKLTYDRFKEFFSTLTFNDYVLSIIRDISKR